LDQQGCKGTGPKTVKGGGRVKTGTTKFRRLLDGSSFGLANGKEECQNDRQKRKSGTKGPKFSNRKYKAGEK